MANLPPLDPERLRGAIQKDIDESKGSPPATSFLLEQQWESDIARKKGEAEIESLNQDRVERKKYAHFIFIMLCIWLFLMLCIIIVSGFGKFPFYWPFKPLIVIWPFKLSDAVIITLITTTTANIAAFFVWVVRYLFPGKD